ncbi:MBL fold metallo-hydrolase [Paenibacillus dendritiformis]|uniref:MBL fold metallo-hydrolase n=1 Tax=Paenibacillus dendritiformis TaxID=130049 RepID=UPI000DA9AF2C|nr:MBL fold metallo-hydrolase [Paenibacillus dendritiformis]PZM64069.1 MBL fold metallo-hydrolase [Paenibacillus dendritiformis]
MLNVTVWGGAGEHGRSCYYIQHDECAVLLDCGGKKEEGGVYPLLDPDRIHAIEAVFLSHAHEDHSMALPLLYRSGYAGEVWTSRATASQLPAYFQAWRSYAQSAGAKVPYGEEDVRLIRFRYVEDEAPPGEWFAASPQVRACWGPSGHALGAIWLLLDIRGKRIFYSGDYCAESLLLKAEPPGPSCSGRTLPAAEKVDVSIIDAAYGEDARRQQELLSQLAAKIEEVLQRGGHVLLPVPLFGRSQELLLWLHERFPGQPLAVESAIADAAGMYRQWPEWFQADAVERLRRCLRSPLLALVGSDDERMRVLEGPPRVILVTDGMMHTPASRFYYEQLNTRKRNAVLFTGHLGRDSFGAAVAAGSTCEVRRFRYKIHQGLPDVQHMMDAIPSTATILAHAPKEMTDRLRHKLGQLGYQGLYSLHPGCSIRI